MSETEAMQEILRIIREQQALEKHQRSKGASVNTIQDSMVYAYQKIIGVVDDLWSDK